MTLKPQYRDRSLLDSNKLCYYYSVELLSPGLSLDMCQSFESEGGGNELSYPLDADRRTPVLNWGTQSQKCLCLEEALRHLTDTTECHRCPLN